MKDILNLASHAAKEAGEFLLHNFENISSIEAKADRNLATNLDREAENDIVKKIIGTFPDHDIFGEEGEYETKGSDYTWIIDPLDGTHNFIRGIDVYGVSIGIMHKNKFVAGVIYMPVSKELYTAEKGSGAFKNGKKISVSKGTDIRTCSLSYDSSIRYNPDLILGILKDLSHEVFNIRMTGSSVRLLSYLAEGKFDASVEFCDRAWDFSAGAVLIEEAGGIITELNGSPLNLNSRGYLAGNPVFYERIKQIITPHFK